MLQLHQLGHEHAGQQGALGGDQLPHVGRDKILRITAAEEVELRQGGSLRSILLRRESAPLLHRRREHFCMDCCRNIPVTLIDPVGEFSMSAKA